MESCVRPNAKAEELVTTALKSAGKKPGDEDYEEIFETQAAKVLGVLMRWQANAHLYRNVANGVTAGGKEGAGTAVAAVYSLIACVNHSCRQGRILVHFSAQPEPLS